MRKLFFLFLFVFSLCSCSKVTGNTPHGYYEYDSGGCIEAVGMWDFSPDMRKHATRVICLENLSVCSDSRAEIIKGVLDSDLIIWKVDAWNDHFISAVVNMRAGYLKQRLCVDRKLEKVFILKSEESQCVNFEEDEVALTMINPLK